MDLNGGKKWSHFTKNMWNRISLHLVKFYFKKPRPWSNHNEVSGTLSTDSVSFGYGPKTLFSVIRTVRNVSIIKMASCFKKVFLWAQCLHAKFESKAKLKMLAFGNKRLLHSDPNRIVSQLSYSTRHCFKGFVQVLLWFPHKHDRRSPSLTCRSGYTIYVHQQHERDEYAWSDLCLICIVNGQ